MNRTLQTILEWMLISLTFILFSITGVAVFMYKAPIDVSFMLFALTVLMYIISVKFKALADRR